MKVTILGCGCSMGVPSVHCKCAVCSSDDPKNKRLRTSALIETDDGNHVLIDTSPDLRAQALTHGFSSVSGVFYTHAHADHTNGVDDLRVFASESHTRHRLYSDEYTLDMVQGRFHNLFDNKAIATGGRVCKMEPHIVEHYKPFNIGGVEFVAFPQEHGNISSNGLCFGDIAYCTDVHSIDAKGYEMLRNKKVLFLECIGYKPSISHAHYDMVLDWIADIQPEITVTIHMGHAVDYNELKEKFSEYMKSVSYPGLIIPGYDGYSITV